MMGYFKTYYRYKADFQKHIFTDERFSEARGRIDIQLKKKHYPIEHKLDGLNYQLDEYRGYISGYLPYFHFKSTDSQFIEDLTYQELSRTIDMVKNTTVDIEKAKISKLHFELTISPSYQANQIIKDNILMFDMKGYNQYIGDANKVFKKFEYTNFTLGVYANKNREGYSNKLKVRLEFKKGEKLKDMGIINLLDLKDKVKLRILYAEFLKRFNQLTIVDSISNYDQFSSGEQKDILLYMNVNYWIGLPPTAAGRKARERAKKNFKSLQEKYNLNTIRLEIRSLIEEEFERLINN